MKVDAKSADGKVRRRVALMTWFSYHNYGSALQVAALCHCLRRLGHEVDVVNYAPTGKYFSRPFWNGTVEELRELVRRGLVRLARRNYAPETRERLFDEFLADSLTMTVPCLTQADLEGLNDDYDVFVCGSDQIWAPSVFDPHYFLDFAGDDRLKVAYAPSVGLPSVEDQDVARQMARLCCRIDALSTREESGSHIISDLTSREVATVLDPTLLVGGDWWKGLAGERTIVGEEPYLLAYMLGRDEAHWRRVYAIGVRLGLPVRVIPVFTADLRREGCIKDPVGPREFVSLISHATYVCTDSFHGVAFSVNLERDFCAFERFKRGDASNQNSRIYNILDKVGLRSRLATRDVSDEESCAPIAWDGPREKLVAERERSLAWLEHALSLEPRLPAHKDNVLRDRTLCCGCTACEAVCPAGAIEVALDVEGFWRASVDEGACVSCGRCRKACPFIEHSRSKSIGQGTLFSYKCSDVAQLLESSSGGAAAAFSKAASDAGAAVLGCVFDVAEGGAVGRLVEPSDVDGLASLAGSKYMQSRVGGSLAEAAKHDGPLLVTGTPCQVAAARNLLGERDGVAYVDLICHGVPTRLLYERYREWLSAEHGVDLSKARTVFRYKPKGWREIYIYTTDGESEVCLHQRRDPYFLIFEAGQCYAGCCYECPWRATSAADVRLGDYWGPRYEDDGTGVSMVLALTERGEELVRGLSATGDVAEAPIGDYLSYQQTANFPEPAFRDAVLEGLADPDIGIQAVCDEFAEPVAKRRDLYRRLEPLRGVAKRILGRR
jgi:coenzyme F420-reducing hydrogenase beta subunit